MLGLTLNSLALNFSIWHVLRQRYVYLLLVLPVLCMGVAFYVLWPLAMWLGGALGIPPDVPVREQKNGVLWFVLLILMLSVFLIIGNVIGFLLNALVAALLGWPRDKVIAVFIHSKVPDHWLLPVEEPQGER